MRLIPLTTALIISAAVAGTAPALADACDLTDLNCSGGKCNIKFRNKTGLGGGSGAGSEHNQISRAATLRISAHKDNGKMAGSNSLAIDAGDSKTFNLDKKSNFATVHIAPKKPFESSASVTMDCKDVRATLLRSGNCDVFAAASSSQNLNSVGVRYYLGYNCAGGVVVSAKPKK